MTIEPGKITKRLKWCAMQLHKNHSGTPQIKVIEEALLKIEAAVDQLEAKA